MNEKRSCCCGVLPPLWWWLLALAGLGLLFWLMASNRRPAIESDLAARTNQSLSAAGLTWAQAKLDKRGRDVILEGQAPDVLSQQQAIDIAQKVHGVRVVDGQWGTALAAGKALATGVAANNANAEANRSADAASTTTTTNSAANSVNPANEANASGTTTEANAANTAAGAAPTQAATTAADASAIASVSSETVTAPDATAANPTGSTANGLAPEPATSASTTAQTGATSTDSASAGAVTTETAGTAISTTAPSSSQAPSVLPSFMAKMVDGKLTLDGTLPEQTQVNTVLAEARQLLGADNVVNNLKLMSPADVAALKADANNLAAINTDWLAKLNTLLGLLPKKDGQLSLDQGIVTIAGMVENDTARNSIITSANKALQGSGLNLLDRLQLAKTTEPAASDVASAAKSPNDASSISPADAGAQATASDPNAGQPAPILGIDPAAKSTETAVTPTDIRGTEPKTEADRAALDCQNQLDQAMSGKEIQFATNKADIRPASRPALNQIASVIKACNQALTGRKVRISGHTDNVGNPAYNVDLSQRRASSVKIYLQKAGVPADLLESQGFGAENPIADNATEAGRAKNRRISFDIKNGG